MSSNNPITKLNNLFQPPNQARYRIISGPPENPKFSIELCLQERIFYGEGKSKKEAKRASAQKAVESLILSSSNAMKSNGEKLTQKARIQPSAMELPDEIWLKIMEYLSTTDILRKIARVNKRFYRLSKDQNLIKEMEFKTIEFTRFPHGRHRYEKYYNDFFVVAQNAQKLKFLSLHLSQYVNEPLWNSRWNFTTHNLEVCSRQNTPD